MTIYDNPYSESLFRTLKYRPEYPSHPFTSLEQARTWVERFVEWYNCEHLHGEIGFVTPQSKHNGQDEQILARRTQVYKKAKEKNPERWSRSIRNWQPITEVHLNPGRTKKTSIKRQETQSKSPSVAA